MSKLISVQNLLHFEIRKLVGSLIKRYKKTQFKNVLDDFELVCQSLLLSFDKSLLNLAETSTN